MSIVRQPLSPGMRERGILVALRAAYLKQNRAAEQR